MKLVINRAIDYLLSLGVTDCGEEQVVGSSQSSVSVCVCEAAEESVVR